MNGSRINMFYRFIKLQDNIPVQIQTGRSIHRHRKKLRLYLQRISFFSSFFPFLLFFLHRLFGQSHTPFLVNLVHHTQRIGFRNQLSQSIRGQIIHLESQCIPFTHHRILNPITDCIVSRITFNDKRILLIKIQSLNCRQRISLCTKIQRKTIQLFPLAFHQILHRILFLK